MGGKIRILEFNGIGSGGCLGNDDADEVGLVHAQSLVGGDSSTLCGLPICDEAKRYEYTRDAVSCPHCIRELEHRPQYIKRLGKWY